MLKYMHILFITEKFPPIVCAGNRIYYLAKYISKDHKVTVMSRKNNRWLFPMPTDYTLKIPKDIIQINFIINDSLFLIPTMLLFKFNLISNSKFYFKNIKKIIDTNLDDFKKYDLVISSGPSWDSFKAAEYLYDKLKIPYILDYRDPWLPKNKIEFNNQNRILQKAKQVVTVTDSCVSIIKKQTNYHKKIHVVENGVDLECIKHFNLSKKASAILKIGFAGRFVNYHNVDKLIYAISILPKDIKNKIIFIGAGSLYKKYKSLCKKLNVNSTFYGHLSVNKMNSVLYECDLLYTGNNVYNAIGSKFYTYLSLNKPLLIYTIKGSQLEKDVLNNKLGFISYSEKELSEIIKKIYLNKNVLNENKFNIKKYIENYDWKILSKKYDYVIKK
jgi:glycosyltransferase involved in cell wall biosynthesis